MKRILKITAALMSLCMIFSACSKDDSGNSGEAAGESTVSESQSVTTPDDELSVEDITVYTGKEVENEEDLAIFKFNCTVPEGYKTVVDGAEGKNYVSENGSSIIVKAQNYKEEFQELAVFADSGCASIKINNSFYQADTDFSDPVNTTVAGFDAIRYDYKVTAYIYMYEVDENGEFVFDEEGNAVPTGEKEIYGEYVNRVYYFYSDEDAFYIICESPKAVADEEAKIFDEFISSVSITKK